MGKEYVSKTPFAQLKVILKHLHVGFHVHDL